MLAAVSFFVLLLTPVAAGANRVNVAQNEDYYFFVLAPSLRKDPSSSDFIFANVRLESRRGIVTTKQGTAFAIAEMLLRIDCNGQKMFEVETYFAESESSTRRATRRALADAPQVPMPPNSLNAAAFKWICNTARSDGLVSSYASPTQPSTPTSQLPRPRPPHDWQVAGENAEVAVHFDPRSLRREDGYIRGSTFVGYSDGSRFNSEVLSVVVDCATRGIAVLSKTRYKNGTFVEGVETSQVGMQFATNDLPASSSMTVSSLCASQIAQAPVEPRSVPPPAKPAASPKPPSPPKKTYANPF